MVFYTEGVFKMNVNRLTAHIPYRIRVANKRIMEKSCIYGSTRV